MWSAVKDIADTAHVGMSATNIAGLATAFNTRLASRKRASIVPWRLL